MSKYESLGKFLKSQHSDCVPMTFRQIEAVTGTRLPSSKRYAAWWSNNTSNNVMTKIWLEAGFRTEQVDIAAGKLVFRRTGQVGLREEGAAFKSGAGHFSLSHPLIGALKGTFTIEGWDATKPALDPDELRDFGISLERAAGLIEQGLEG